MCALFINKKLENGNISCISSIGRIIASKEYGRWFSGLLKKRIRNAYKKKRKFDTVIRIHSFVMMKSGRTRIRIHTHKRKLNVTGDGLTTLNTIL